MYVPGILYISYDTYIYIFKKFIIIIYTNIITDYSTKRSNEVTVHSFIMIAAFKTNVHT